MINKTRLLVLTAAAVLLVACSGEEAAKVPDPASTPNAPAPGGGGGDPKANPDPSAPGSASPDQQKPKGGGDDKPGAVIGTCKDAMPGSLPQVTSEFRVGTAPAPKGGDEKGTWYFTKITAYLTTTGGALMDEDASKAEGFGFVKFDGARFQVASDITQTISTKITGRVVQASTMKIAGKYTRDDGGRLTFEPECQEIEPAQADQEPPSNTSFSRISDTEALFHQTSETPIGAVTIVTTMKKASN